MVKQVIANIDTIRDSDWIRTSFMLSVNRQDPTKGRLTEEDKSWLYFTTAKYKYTNTSVGGNHHINPPPQFTLFADPPVGGIKSISKELADTRTADPSFLGGMGRYYSESIDDWSQRVSFQFGTAEYKGLITFFTGFYDAGAATLGRQGRLFGGLFYLAGRVIGAIVALPLTMLIWVGEVVQWLTNRPTSRYYNMKATMPLYWQRVNLIANMLAANMGIVERNFLNKGDQTTDYSNTLKLMNEMDPRRADESLGSYMYEEVHKYYPKMFSSKGGVDVYWIANKANRMQDIFINEARREVVRKRAMSGKDLKRVVDNQLLRMTFKDPAAPQQTLDEYLHKYHDSRLGATRMPTQDGSGGYQDLTGMDVVSAKAAEIFAKGPQSGTSVGAIPEAGQATQLSEGTTANPATSTTTTPGASTTTTVPVEGTATPQSVEGTTPASDDYAQMLTRQTSNDNLIYSIWAEDEEKTAEDGSTLLKIVEGWGKDFADYAVANNKGAAEWINFRVDAMKSVNESFSNNVGESSISSKINNMSSGAADLRFSLSDLNTGFGAIDTLVNGVRDFFAGVADGMHVSGLMTLMGSGFIDIPKRWTDSSADVFPSATYTIKCRPPYGNALSRFLNMHIPIACILAGMLPISYGRHAYGSPFLCQFYVQGKHQSRLAMITNLSITRGEGTLGWDEVGNFLGCDINFTVTDLSAIVHAPIDTGMNQLLSFRWILSDDNNFNDYMAALSNLSVAEMTYNWEKLKRNFNQYVVTQQNFFAPSSIAMSFSGSLLGRMVRKVTPSYNQSVYAN